MNTAEFPPHDTEHTEDMPEQLIVSSPENQVDLEIARDKSAEPPSDAEEVTRTKQEVLKAIKKSEDYVPEQPDILRTVKKSEDYVAPASTKAGWWKTFKSVAALGIAGLFAGGAQGATGEGKTGNENKKASTEKTVTATPQKKLSGISFYAGGTEKTPTGKDNAFSTNMDTLSEGDLIAMAEKFGLPTTSNIEFQKALLEKYPAEVQAVMEEYGQTNAGTFTDGVLGARVKKVLEKIQQANEPTTPQITTPSAPSPAPEGNSSKKIERVPIANYLINVRGDEKNGDGAYYFFETEEALREALSALRTVDANPKSVEFRGKKYGQASFDMNASVFDTYYAKTPEIKALLGEKMTRDPENPNFFIPKK